MTTCIDRQMLQSLDPKFLRVEGIGSRRWIVDARTGLVIPDQRLVSFEEFQDSMGINPDADGLYGIEHERGIFCRHSGRIIPGAPRLLRGLDPAENSNEPSSCQIEGKTLPYRTGREVRRNMRRVLRTQDRRANRLGMELRTMPVLPAGMPTDIFPSRKYIKLAKMLRERGDMDAVLRVTSTQPNLGFGNWHDLLEAYNRLVEALPKLIAWGDKSAGLRRRMYTAAVPHHQPKYFESPYALYAEALRRGVASKPGKMHTDIMIKPGGIIEVRCIDAMADVAEMDDLMDEVARIAGRYRRIRGARVRTSDEPSNQYILI